MDFLDFVEDMVHVYQVFKLSVSTLFLALSIIQRAFITNLTDTSPSVLLTGIIPKRDITKSQAYLSLSIAAKYNERIMFRFEEFIEALRFESS